MLLGVGIVIGSMFLADGWLYRWLNSELPTSMPSAHFSNTNKLFKAAKIYQDCMIIDDKIYDY